jgi:hypothetical protein
MFVDLSILCIGVKTNRQEEYFPLIITGKKLDLFVSGLRDKLLQDFWSSIPEGPQKDAIRSRLEVNIISALKKMG